MVTLCTILLQASAHPRASTYSPISTILQFGKLFRVTIHPAKCLCGDSNVSLFPVCIIAELTYTIAIAFHALQHEVAKVCTHWSVASSAVLLLAVQNTLTAVINAIEAWQ